VDPDLRQTLVLVAAKATNFAQAFDLRRSYEVAANGESCSTGLRRTRRISRFGGVARRDFPRLAPRTVRCQDKAFVRRTQGNESRRGSKV